MAAAVNSTQIQGYLQIQAGSLTNTELSSSAAVARSKLATDAQFKYTVPLTDLRLGSALTSVLGSSASGSDLGLIQGTFATASPEVESSDSKNTTVTQATRFQLRLPAEYVAAAALVVRITAGMKTTVASSSATIVIACYKVDGSSGIGANLVTTAATSINNLTAATKDFTIDGSTLNPGDMLDSKITIAITDVATGTAVIGRFGLLQFLVNVQG